MIRPWFASEKLLPGPPFKGCRISTLWHGYAMATNNESATNPETAQPKGKAGRTADLLRGWRAFSTSGDDNGIPDQGDVNRICEAMFPKLPKPQLSSGAFSFTDTLEKGLAISVALKLSVLPANSPLRQYTSADHQVLLYGLSSDKTKTRRIDPMHNHSDSYVGEWVPLDDVRQAAKPFGFVVELFPIGAWTQEALLRSGTVRPLRKEVDDLNAKVDTLKVSNASLRKRVDDLTEELADCKAGQDCDAAREQLLDALHEFEMEQRAA